MIITEEEKKVILSKYQDNTSNELLTYLKRHFPVVTHKFDWVDKPFKQLSIDQKTYRLDGNKKYLVGKLFNILESDWVHLGEPLIRRTIKKFIDGISL